MRALLLFLAVVSLSPVATAHTFEHDDRWRFHDEHIVAVALGVTAGGYVAIQCNEQDLAATRPQANEAAYVSLPAVKAADMSRRDVGANATLDSERKDPKDWVSLRSIMNPP